MDPINIGDDKLFFGTGRARRAREASPSFDVVTEIGQSGHGCVENGGCLIEEEKRE